MHRRVRQQPDTPDAKVGEYLSAQANFAQSAAVAIFITTAFGGAILLHRRWNASQPAAPSSAMRTIPLTSFPDEELDPALSPDGKLICFTGHAEGGVTVFVMNHDGTSKRQVVRGISKVGATFPNWSPGGPGRL